MNATKLVAVFGIFFWLCGLTVAVVLSQDNPVPLPPLPSTISGIVSDENGPVAGAVVQIQAKPLTTETAEDGSFMLTGIEGPAPLIVTAWTAGYYVGWTTVDPSAPDWAGGSGLSITMDPISQGDNNEYHWFSFEGVEGSASCGICHREFKEYQQDQHSRAAINHHFLNLYTGTDVHGNEGQPTQWSSDGKALPPDPNQPYYGPGLRLDTPDRAGNCAACHTPLASTAPNNQNCSWSGCHTSLTVERSNGVIPRPALPVNLSGDAGEGVSCDFCHKIGDVIIDPKTNLPYPDMPGILSLRLYRPAEDGRQVFFGTLMDVNRSDTYLPLLAESKFCAGCHYGVMGGVVGMGTVTGGTLIYNSYGEWLDSPYSDPETGKTCQDCHMPVSDANWFVYPEQGGLVRDYQPLHNHTMPGAVDENLLQNTVTMVSTAQRDGDHLQVEVNITNDRAGHDVPTDTPIRSMILVVEAQDANGNPLKFYRGPINPGYSGDYGGLPGKTFAKVLRDDWTGETPTGAIWRPVTIVADTRLRALATDTTHYVFDVPDGVAATVNVRLIFRRAFYRLMQEKGWDDPDILMEHDTLQIPAS